MQDMELGVESDVAKANLLRMRGEYSEARTLLEQVLARTPKSAIAHELMGDIMAQQAQLAVDPTSDLRSAMHWYELGLQMDPASTNLSAKATAMRKRIEEVQAGETLKLLGIPTASKRLYGFMAATAAFVVLIAVASWLIGRAAQQPPAPQPYQQPIEVKLPTPEAPKTVDEKLNQEPKAAEPKAEPVKPAVVASVASDADFVTRLKTALADGTDIAAATFDPRMGGQWVITANTTAEATTWEGTAANIGKVALSLAADASHVTVRLASAQTLVYVADFDRPSGDAKPDPPPPVNQWTREEPKSKN